MNSQKSYNNLLEHRLHCKQRSYDWEPQNKRAYIHFHSVDRMKSIESMYHSGPVVLTDYLCSCIQNVDRMYKSRKYQQWCNLRNNNNFVQSLLNIEHIDFL